MALVLTTEEVAQLRTAYIKILSGQSVQEIVDANGEKMRFSNTNLAQLEALLGAQGAAQGATRPMGFLF